MSELSLFGSVARDEARDDSDVAVMVSFLSTPSFTSFMELKDYLEQRLGARVDLVTRAGLKARVTSCRARGAPCRVTPGCTSKTSSSSRAIDAYTAARVHLHERQLEMLFRQRPRVGKTQLSPA